jgi:hypothetical protein
MRPQKIGGDGYADETQQITGEHTGDDGEPAAHERALHRAAEDPFSRKNRR